MFTNPIPADKCFATAGADSFVQIGARTKCRALIVGGRDKHPVRSTPTMAAKARSKTLDFMAVPLAAFFTSTRPWGCVRGIRQDRRRLGPRCSIPPGPVSDRDGERNTVLADRSGC